MLFSPQRSSTGAILKSYGLKLFAVFVPFKWASPRVFFRAQAQGRFLRVGLCRDFYMEIKLLTHEIDKRICFMSKGINKSRNTFLFSLTRLSKSDVMGNKLSQATAGTSQIVGKQKPAENNFHDICKIFCIKDVGLGVREKGVEQNMTINHRGVFF